MDDIDEIPLYPDLPVVDTHHHLVDRVDEQIAHHLNLSRFLIDEYVNFLGTGHNVVASVAVEARSMYRAYGPSELRFVGETEFLNGQAAMAASGLYGPCLMAAGIVGYADLRIGDSVRDILEAHLAAAPRRFKGIRQSALWDADPTILGDMFDGGDMLYRQPSFRNGFRHLAPLGLSFDAFVLAPQLPDVISLAQAFPETQIILNHVGQPLGIGSHAGKLPKEFPQWRRDMTVLASYPNVAVKLGGLGSFLMGSSTFRSDPPASSARLAAEWSPYVGVTIELFGADRCMFESNVPTDGSGSFNRVCNAYKRMTRGCSEEERRAIFAGTAVRVYRLADWFPDGV